MRHKSALLNNKGEVIGEVFAAPYSGNYIEVAGEFDTDGTPRNIQYYKISRSKKNLEKALTTKPLIRKGEVWAYHNLEI